MLYAKWSFLFPGRKKGRSMENKELRQPASAKGIGRESALQICFVVMFACVALGLALAVLSCTWIEAVFAVDPDGGSGLVEYLLPPLMICIGFAACEFCRFRGSLVRVSGYSRSSETIELPHS